LVVSYQGTAFFYRNVFVRQAARLRQTVMCESVCHAIVVKVRGHIFRNRFCLIHGIAHSHAVARRLEHADVVDTIAKSVGVLDVHAKGCRHVAHGIAFVHTKHRHVCRGMRPVRVEQAGIAQSVRYALAMCRVVDLLI